MRTIIEKKILITILVLLSVAGVIVGVIIIPTVKYIKQLDEETYNLRMTMERKNEQVMNYRIAMKQLDKLKVDMPAFGDHLFYSGEELKLITTLETLANQHGVVQRINNSDIGNVVNNKIQISFSIQGDYSKTLAYLSDLERLSYFINVNKISISPYRDRTDPKPDDVIMNIEISLYVIPQ